MNTSNLIQGIAFLSLLSVSLLTSGCTKAETSPAAKAAAASNSTVPADNKKAQDPAAAQLERFKALPHGVPTVPDSQYVPLNSGYQIAALFYALSGMPPDYEALASAASEDYRGNQDAFRKRDLMLALRPRIDEQIAAYKNPQARYFSMVSATGASIQHYDFKTSSFPIVMGLGPDNAVYFNDSPKFRIGYNNGNDFLHFPVADEQRAKDLETRVAKFELQSCESLLYLYVQQADTANNEVKAEVMRVVLKDAVRHDEVARF